MNIIWLLLKIIVYTNVLIWTYRILKIVFIEFLEKPILWIFAASLLGLSNSIVSYYFQWNPRLAMTAFVLSAIFILSTTPSDKSTREDSNVELDKTYQDVGTSRERFQLKMGFWGYVLISMIGHVLFFGEICSNSGDCVSFIHILFR